MSQAESSEDRPTVLVVEDDAASADLYSAQLATTYRVQTTYSGAEGLEAVGPQVDVVLLDRRMPELSGDAVLEELRERGLDCRIIMVTAVEPDLDIIALPFDEYLVKPVSEAALRDAVDRMLARTHLDATLQEFVAVVSKMATLEAKLDIADLHASEEYGALETRFVSLQEELRETVPDDSPYSGFVEDKLQALAD